MLCFFFPSLASISHGQCLMTGHKVLRSINWLTSDEVKVLKVQGKERILNQSINQSINKWNNENPNEEKKWKCLFSAPINGGADGSVDKSSIQPGELDQTGKHSYPIVLLRVIKRQAEDLLWKGEVTQGRAALHFLKSVTEERTDSDAVAINKGIV